VDARDNVFIADSYNNRVRRVDAATGIITTVAGSGQSSTPTGDGGPATAATLSTPDSVAVDASGNLFIADTGHGVIRRVDALTGNISTVAGTTNSNGLGDNGPATAAYLGSISAIAVDRAGNLYIAESSGNGRVMRVDFATGIISPF